MIPAWLLPEGVRWVVAGGWAACPALASDQDIWVLVDADEMSDMRDRILDGLRDYYGDDYDARVTELEDRRSMVVDRQSEVSDNTYETVPVNTLKVASVYTHGLERHILVTDASCAYELVEAFDINTHAVAIEPDGNIVKSALWAPFTEPPIMVRDTPTTKMRMNKIRQRYGHPPIEEV